MRAVLYKSDAHVPIVIALHCILNIPPLVNYLVSSELEADLYRKRVNAVAFTRTLAKLADAYWSNLADPGLDLDVSEAALIFKKIHRASHVSSTMVLKQVCSILKDSLSPSSNYMDDLGAYWLVHEPGCKHDTVQQLINNSTIDGLPHLIFIHLNRGERTKRFIDYGTSLRVVKSNKYIDIHRYELANVLMDDDKNDCDVYGSSVYAKSDASVWEYITATDNVVKPVLDLNQIISVKAQVLVYLWVVK